MSLKLRPLQADDLEQVVQVWLSAWVSVMAQDADSIDATMLPGTEKAFWCFLLAHLSDGSATNDQLIVGSQGGQISGFYNLDSIAGEITDLWVAPQWQRQGIATALMHDAKDKCWKLGHKALVLKVKTTNERAIAFYKKEGLVEQSHIQQEDPLLKRTVEKVIMRATL